ncbi:hypothetical protein CROQUDRAFT_21699, partial [Cronartium quercuum f. sp. fusiforme G11]
PSTSKNRLSIPGFEKLTTAGANSNYLDWSLMAKSVLQTEGLLHTITPTEPKDRPSSYKNDCLKVKTFFLCYVEKANYTVLCQCGDDMVAMWNALQSLHLDSSSASKMFWLKSIVTEKMEGDNMDAYLDRVQDMYDHLDLLVTQEKPLRTDDILAAAISLAVLPEWQHVLTALLQCPNITSNEIISALRSEGVRCWTQSITGTEVVTVSKAKVVPPPSHHTSESSGSQSRQPRIGKANAATVQSDNNSSATIDLSDSESAMLVHTTKTVSSMSTSMPMNLDSGCSKSMAPPSKPLTNVQPASTHVTLANNSVIKATATGTTTLPLTVDKSVSMLQVPGLNEPLLSVSDLVDEGLVLEFNDQGCDIRRRGAPEVVGHGVHRNRLFYLEGE